jgi:hypothetical protein
MDRDTVFTAEFRNFLKQEGVKAVRLPPRSPNLNAYAERFVRSIKESCLNRMIFFGENSLRNAINEFLAHYHHERNHQGLGNRLIDPGEEVGVTEGSIACRERLGGLLRYYYHQAAQLAWGGNSRSRESRARSKRRAPRANRLRPPFWALAAAPSDAIEFLDSTPSRSSAASERPSQASRPPSSHAIRTRAARATPRRFDPAGAAGDVSRNAGGRQVADAVPSLRQRSQHA